jgi:hypothetical protein
MTATVSVEGDQLVVEMQGLDRLWALKSTLTIPLVHVRGVSVDASGLAGASHGIRAPGTYVPGVITAGTFHLDGERVFWDVHDPTRAVVVELADEKYTRLIVQVEDPAATVALIQGATGRA